MINSQTLASVLKTLKENKIRCGIGGSYLLQLYDLCDEPNDIDFWVEPNDMQKVRLLFREYDEIIEKIQLPAQYHYKFRYFDMDIDFVACFITRPNQHEYVYNIRPESIEIITTSDGLDIPCTSLEDWYIVYKLLNREEKASLIEKYIYKKNIVKTNERLNRFIKDKENVLPQRVTNDVNSFVWDNMQMRFEELYNIGECIYEKKNL